MANLRRGDSGIDEATWPARAITRSGSSRGVEPNRRRVYRRALDAGGIARGNLIRPRSPARFALRSRASFQDRHSAAIETTLRRQNHPRRPIPHRLICTVEVDAFLRTSRRGV